MKFPRNLFRRKSCDRPSVLDYETTEALASVLAGSPSSNDFSVTTTDDGETSTTTDFEKPTSNLVVDWKLPVFDSNTTNKQTIEDELSRLIALQSYNLLETEREETFDRIASLAADILQAPVAAINLVDLGRTWFLAGHNTGEADGQPSRIESACAHVIQGKTNRPLIVPDLTNDFRFKGYSSVTGPPYFRFYAGAPLVSPEGHKLGALCVVDFCPRKGGLSGFEEEILIDLAAMAMKIMVERRDKMMEYVNEMNQDSKHFGNNCYDSLENLLGPPLTNIPKLIQSLNMLVKPLPKKVPISIELDTKVPIEIECSDVLLLRAALTLLSHSAGRTETGSIHLRILYKKKCVVFECQDTGPFVSTKTKHVEQYFDSIPKSSNVAAMVSLVRAMDGEYGIYSGSSSSCSSSTVFWFSSHKSDSKGGVKSNFNPSNESALRTIHSPNQSIETTARKDLKKLTLSDDRIDGACNMCQFKP